MTCTLNLTSTGYTSDRKDPGCDIGATKTGHYKVGGVQAWSIQQVTTKGEFVKTVGSIDGGVTANNGTTFVVFNRDQYINNFTADLIGPNDGNDWVFVDNEVKKAGALPTSIAEFKNFTVNLGDESAPPGPTSTDNDIFYVGTAKVQASSGGTPTAGTPTVIQGGNTVGNEVSVDYVADQVTANMGKGNDSVVYGGANIVAGATKTSITNTVSNMGTGSDSVGFNQVQAIGAGNVINLGTDSDIDTVNFVNYKAGVNQFNAGSSTTINNFGTDDILIIGGASNKAGTGKAGAQQLVTDLGLTSFITIT